MSLIPERSGTRLKKEQEFRRPIGPFLFASRISGVQASGLVTAWGQLPERSPGCWPQEREQASTREERQRRQPGSADFSVFFGFPGRLPEPGCRCCRGCPPVLLRVLVGNAAAVRVAQTKATGGPTPAQRGGAGAGGVETGPATFLDPGGRSREAQRSGFSPWKRSFCSSGSDRTGTVSCRWSPAPRFDCASGPRRTAATKLVHGMVRWIDGKVKRKLAGGSARWSRWKGQTAC